MIRTASEAMMFALYQLTILVGILLLPLAMLVRKLGVPFPLHRLVKAVEGAYETTATA